VSAREEQNQGDAKVSSHLTGAYGVINKYKIGMGQPISVLFLFSYQSHEQPLIINRGNRMLDIVYNSSSMQYLVALDQYYFQEN
jgi:hypothetical protein